MKVRKAIYTCGWLVQGFYQKLKRNQRKCLHCKSTLQFDKSVVLGLKGKDYF